MSKLKDEFDKFHKENPEVWELFVKFTFDVVNTGRKNYSVKAVFERIRWHTDIETTGKPFKLSNNHTAYYARHFHEKYPEHEGFFKTKQLRSVA